MTHAERLRRIVDKWAMPDAETEEALIAGAEALEREQWMPISDKAKTGEEFVIAGNGAGKSEYFSMAFAAWDKHRKIWVGLHGNDLSYLVPSYFRLSPLPPKGGE